MISTTVSCFLLLDILGFGIRNAFAAVDEERCSDPPNIPNGSVVGDKTGEHYVVDDFVMVKCDSGFSPKNGSTLISCEEGGQWDSKFPQCEVVLCKLPPDLENGRIPELKETKSTVFLNGFQLTYECNPGFRLIGDRMRSCGSRGWSGKAPHCQVIRCCDPGFPEYGKREGHNFNIGRKVTFSCFSGYTLIGSAERYCLPNGQWSGELARCDTESNYCPDPGIPINGWKSGSRYDEGETVVYGCHPGYFLVSSTKRKCKTDHSWSGVEPKCRGNHDFDNRAEVAQKLITLAEEQAYEQRRQDREYFENLEPEGFEIPGLPGLPGLPGPGGYPGPTEYVPNRRKILWGRVILYFVFDSSGSIKEGDFKTSIEFAKAFVREVGISSSGARIGAMSFNSIANIEFLPSQYSTTDEVLRALDNIKQSPGGTATRTALEKMLKEMIPSTRIKLNGKIVKSVVFLITDGKSNMGGDPEEQAKEIRDAGVEMYCIGITGDVDQKSLHKMASVPSEEHVFILNSYESLAWLIQQITVGSVDYSKCGLGLKREPASGTSRMKYRTLDDQKAIVSWPWMAALYIDGKLFCGASIIDRSWILTAAHCLIKAGTKRELNTVIVKLGLMDVKNSRHLQEFEPEEFVIHERYHPVHLDYDIALIKLDRPINYNKYVRPICLPPKVFSKNTTFYKPRGISYAIGWGENRKVSVGESRRFKTVSHLKELRLPVQSRKTCRRSIASKNYTFTKRMFCVGSGQGDVDTCKGDSGGPLMQSKMNEEGIVFWVQIGIISWGEGCRVMNTYGFNTHVRSLRGWIDKITNSEET